MTPELAAFALFALLFALFASPSTTGSTAMSGETTHWIRDVAGTSRRRCAFCADRARYLYEPKTPMCGWHLILFYISLDTEWRG